MTSIWLKYDKNCFLCKPKIAKTKITQKNPNPTSSQKRKKPNGYKHTQIHKRAQNLQTLISTRKPPKITQNKTIKSHTQNRAHKNAKAHNKTTHKITQNATPPKIPTKSQTPYPPSQIFANPLFVACQHLSHKIVRFPNHTPCQSSSLLVAYFGLPLCQRHT